MAVILYATLTADPLGGGDLSVLPHLDKLVHMVMMGGLTGAIAFDYGRAHPDRTLSRRLMLLIFVGVAIFACIDEWLQGALQIGRPSDPLDLAANLAGALVATYVSPPVIRIVLHRH